MTTQEQPTETSDEAVEAPKIKKLTIKAETVDYAIRQGLERLGLSQEQTHIRVLQRETKSIFGDKDAIVAILYDEAESQQAIYDKHTAEFESKFAFRFANDEAQVRVPAIFYDPRFFRGIDERVEYLTTYLEGLEVSEPNSELIAHIATDYQCQYDYYPVKQYETTPVGDLGATAVLSVDKEKMRCRALIFHGGGCTEEDLFRLLKQNQITHGILKQNIEAVIKEQYAYWFDIARGVPTQNDEPARLEKFFHEDEHKEFAKMMEALTIDTRQVKDINIAERNQLLVRIGEVKEGSDGYNIMGEVLSKQSIDDLTGGLKLGSKVMIDDLGKEVFAKEAGHIVWRADELFLDVEPLYVVEGNVDFNEGNIVDFVGKVLIKGDVMPKFSVSAEGDIEVHGSVQDATLVSKRGDVMVAGSIVHKNGGSVTAHRTVHAGIATNARVIAQKIMIDKEALNSHLEAVADVEVIGSPGVIVGGYVQANEIVKANTIGSESWVPTKIHIGDVTEMKQRLRALRQKIARLKGKLQEAQAVVKILTKKAQKSSLTEAQEQQMDLASAEIEKHEETLDYAEEEERQLKDQITRCRPARLEVLKELYPQVDIFIFEGHMVPSSIEQHTGFRCKDGRLQRYSL